MLVIERFLTNNLKINVEGLRNVRICSTSQIQISNCWRHGLDKFMQYKSCYATIRKLIIFPILFLSWSANFVRPLVCYFTIQSKYPRLLTTNNNFSRWLNSLVMLSECVDLVFVSLPRNRSCSEFHKQQLNTNRETQIIIKCFVLFVLLYTYKQLRDIIKIGLLE